MIRGVRSKFSCTRWLDQWHQICYWQRLFLFKWPRPKLGTVSRKHLLFKYVLGSSLGGFLVKECSCQDIREGRARKFMLGRKGEKLTGKLGYRRHLPQEYGLKPVGFQGVFGHSDIWFESWVVHCGARIWMILVGPFQLSSGHSGNEGSKSYRDLFYSSSFNLNSDSFLRECDGQLPAKPHNMGST